MLAEGEEVHGAEDGTPSGSQSPSGGDVPVSGGRPVRPNREPAAREEEASRQRMGSGVCVHHVEFMDTYSTDSFLMALRRFMGLRGTPTRFQSDRGEQLVAAAKQVSTWDFKEVIQWAGKKGIKWTLVPTGGRHFNGQA
jgi:hypothetical protein